MRLKAVLLGVILLSASTAFAEAGKNSVAIFFGDGTFIHREVASEADVARLRVAGKGYVTAQFYIVPFGGGLPLGPTNSGGNDQISIGFQSRGPGGGTVQPKGISINVANFTPPGARESRFGIDEDVNNDFFNRTFNGPAASASGGMEVAFNTFDFADPLYPLLEECIEPGEDGLFIGVNSQIVPAEGIYYDDNGTPEDDSDDTCTQTF